MLDVVDAAAPMACVNIEPDSLARIHEICIHSTNSKAKAAEHVAPQLAEK